MLPLARIRAALDGPRAFAGLDPGSTVLGARWVFLRALGAVYALAFAGWIVDGLGLIGPRGVMPVVDLLGAARAQLGPARAFLEVPGLFWLSRGAGMLVAAAHDFSPAQLDGLLLEAALLSLYFAPRGLIDASL